MGTYIKEQSVILHTAYDEVILLTGCAHPGLDDIIDYAHKYSQNLKAIVGGFHGFRKFWALEHIDSIYPCHCTQYKEDFMSRFPEHSKTLFVGDVLHF